MANGKLSVRPRFKRGVKYTSDGVNDLVFRNAFAVPLRPEQINLMRIQSVTVTYGDEGHVGCTYALFPSPRAPRRVVVTIRPDLVPSSRDEGDVIDLTITITDLDGNMDSIEIEVEEEEDGP